MYQLGDEIGSGTFAKVHVAFNKTTGDKVAVKIFEKASHTFDEKSVNSEVQIFRKVQIFGHFPRLFDIFENSD